MSIPQRCDDSRPVRNNIVLRLMLRDLPMRTIGLDTNAILCYRLERDPGYQKVRQLFEQCLAGKLRIYIPLPVLLEIEWVLRSYYEQPKEKVVSFFEELLLADNVIMDRKSDIKIALNLYKTNGQVSFTDCCILREIQAHEYEFLTFNL